MNPAHLLAHFERLTDAPDAIPRLRRFILDLAVRGKLVEQDPNDEPAIAQLMRIARAKRGGHRKGRSKGVLGGDSGLTDTEDPLPAGWASAPLSSLVTIINGRAYKRHELLEAGTPVLRVGNLFTSDKWYYSSLQLDPDKYSDKGDLIFAWSASFGPFIWQGPRVIYHYHIWKLLLHSDNELDKRYIYTLLLHKTREIKEAGHGISMIHMTKERMEQLPIPLPPLAEQRRIVAKVDELMALCDQLEARRNEREIRRDRLVAASLHRLSQPSEEDGADAFLADARFYFNHFPRLTTRPDHIKQLRQTILNFAVRGRLVPQDSSDEPASELLKRVPPLGKPPRYAKRSPELIPGDCGLSIGKPNTPLPEGWLWKPLVEIARLESGHTPSRNRPDWWEGDIPWIGLVDARAHNGGTIFDTIQHTNEQGIANSAARVLPAGTVCFSRTASVGYVVIMGRPMATSQDFVNWVPTETISSTWLQLVMIAERPAIGRFSKGAVHQTIYYPAWLAMHIAVPPLAEQHRIVAKVNELMALCDRLEASLATSETTSRRLLEAILHEAIAPAVDHALGAVA